MSSMHKCICLPVSLLHEKPEGDSTAFEDKHELHLCCSMQGSGTLYNVLQIWTVFGSWFVSLLHQCPSLHHRRPRSLGPCFPCPLFSLRVEVVRMQVQAGLRNLTQRNLVVRLIFLSASEVSWCWCCEQALPNRQAGACLAPSNSL